MKLSFRTILRLPILTVILMVAMMLGSQKVGAQNFVAPSQAVVLLQNQISLWKSDALVSTGTTQNELFRKMEVYKVIIHGLEQNMEVNTAITQAMTRYARIGRELSSDVANASATPQQSQSAPQQDAAALALKNFTIQLLSN